MRVEQQLQPGEHRATAGGGECGERPGDVARRLTPRCDDEAQHRLGRLALDPAGLARADKHAGEDARFAEQSLEALLRGRLPSIQRTAAIEHQIWPFDADEQLRCVVCVQHRPIGLEQCVLLGEGKAAGVGQRGAVGCTGDAVGGPAEYVAEQRPWVSAECVRDRARVGGGLWGGPQSDAR